MATSRTRSRRRQGRKAKPQGNVVKRLCAIKATSIATPETLALASGGVIASSDVMREALESVDALEHETQQVGTIRQRLIDLPAASRPRPGTLLL